MTTNLTYTFIKAVLGHWLVKVTPVNILGPSLRNDWEPTCESLTLK